MNKLIVLKEQAIRTKSALNTRMQLHATSIREASNMIHKAEEDFCQLIVKRPFTMMLYSVIGGGILGQIFRRDLDALNKDISEQMRKTVAHKAATIVNYGVSNFISTFQPHQSRQLRASYGKNTEVNLQEKL